jgi:D-alanyl-D-alanine carboxypeptidase
MVTPKTLRLVLASLGCCIWIALFFSTRLATLAQDDAALLDGPIITISQELCSAMKLHKVINSGAPVSCGRLRQIRFSYIGFDGQLQNDGRIVVMDAVADHVLQIFDTLRSRHFPIAKARLMNDYDGDDEASMADNNTSAFNDRSIVGRSSVSVHAYGLAIDINPIQNPYMKREGGVLAISPRAGNDYLDRKNRRPGMAETAIDVFADHGFLIWGGDWRNPIDYQHFQVSRDLVKELARSSSANGQLLFERYVERYRSCVQALPAGAQRMSCIGDARP